MARRSSSSVIVLLVILCIVGAGTYAAYYMNQRKQEEPSTTAPKPVRRYQEYDNGGGSSLEDVDVSQPTTPPKNELVEKVQGSGIPFVLLHKSGKTGKMIRFTPEAASDYFTIEGSKLFLTMSDRSCGFNEALQFECQPGNTETMEFKPVTGSDHVGLLLGGRPLCVSADDSAISVCTPQVEPTPFKIHITNRINLAMAGGNFSMKVALKNDKYVTSTEEQELCVSGESTLFTFVPGKSNPAIGAIKTKENFALTSIPDTDMPVLETFDADAEYGCALVGDSLDEVQVFLDADTKLSVAKGKVVCKPASDPKATKFRIIDVKRA